MADDKSVEIALPYGKRSLPLSVPATNLLGVVRSPSGAAEGDDGEIVARALREPIESPPLRELARHANSACIVVSDITRPCPTHRILPSVLDELAALDREGITVVFALGSHRPHSREEQEFLVGAQTFERAIVVDLDRDLCVPVATTSRGTPLEVFRPYLDAELRICVGNIEYHYFAGFSGGAKAVVPGICTTAAISANHSLMLDPQARAGILNGNPVREDIDEAGGLVGIDFIVNVLLNERKRIVDAVSGHYVAAFREGARRYDALFDLSVERAADVVVVSAGGFPKDVNLYQAQKALDNVRLAVRKGGAVVLVAECAEGFGSATFEQWLTDLHRPQVLIDRIREDFVLGGHKAAAMADMRRDVEMVFVSAFAAETVRAMGLIPAKTPDEGLATARALAGGAGRILVVPHGNRVRAIES